MQDRVDNLKYSEEQVVGLQVSPPVINYRRINLQLIFQEVQVQTLSFPPCCAWISFLKPKFDKEDCSIIHWMYTVVFYSLS